MLSALGDPLNRRIVDVLLGVHSATPGEVARAVRERVPVSRSAISTHITGLVTLGVVRRESDGGLYATDREELGHIMQAARRWAAGVQSEGHAVEAADHYATQRKINAVERQDWSANRSQCAPRELEWPQ